MKSKSPYRIVLHQLEVRTIQLVSVSSIPAQCESDQLQQLRKTISQPCYTLPFVPHTGRRRSFPHLDKVLLKLEASGMEGYVGLVNMLRYRQLCMSTNMRKKAIHFSPVNSTILSPECPSIESSHQVLTAMALSTRELYLTPSAFSSPLKRGCSRIIRPCTANYVMRHDKMTMPCVT